MSPNHGLFRLFQCPDCGAVHRIFEQHRDMFKPRVDSSGRYCPPFLMCKTCVTPFEEICGGLKYPTGEEKLFGGDT